MRGKHSQLSAKSQTELINYFKKLDSKNEKELVLKIKLLPYLANSLSFDNFKKLLKYCFFSDPEYYATPDTLRYAFLAELGYMALREKATSGKAYKFILELQKKQDLKRFIYSRVFGFNSRVLARIGNFTKMYKLFISDFDKNKDTHEFLLACMENQLADKQKRLFIYNYRTIKVEDDMADEKSLICNPYAPPTPRILKVDEKEGMKNDSCVENSQHFFLMLLDMLDYPDPQIRMEAARRLRSETEQNFGFNPVGTPSERKSVAEKWREYLAKHDVIKERHQRMRRKFKQKFQRGKRKCERK